jgi:hypothetical protein
MSEKGTGLQDAVKAATGYFHELFTERDYVSGPVLDNVSLSTRDDGGKAWLVGLTFHVKASEPIESEALQGRGPATRQEKRVLVIDAADGSLLEVRNG